MRSTCAGFLDALPLQGMVQSKTTAGLFLGQVSQKILERPGNAHGACYKVLRVGRKAEQ